MFIWKTPENPNFSQKVPQITSDRDRYLSLGFHSLLTSGDTVIPGGTTPYKLGFVLCLDALL